MSFSDLLLAQVYVEHKVINTSSEKENPVVIF